MSSTTNHLGREPFEQLAEEFIERLRNGEQPSVAEYIDQHPEMGREIRELFPALIMMERVGVRDPLSDATPGPVTRDGSAPQKIGEYTILREVGRGGMGVVYEAEQESLGRRVALKVLPFASLMDANHLKRFQREARAAARLHHSNIVPVYEVGQDDGIHYYAMQFIRGQGLDEVIIELRSLRKGSADKSTGRRGPPGTVPIRASGIKDVDSKEVLPSDASLPADSNSTPVVAGDSGVNGSSNSGNHYFQSVARIGSQVADALSYAHEQGILHRDVKPSNLMLDSTGTVWITDFGLAKSDAKEELTHTGDVVGTLRYMAPERFNGWSDPRSDIYSLGLTLYELITLRPAHDQRDRAELIRSISQDQPPLPRRMDRGIPIDLETTVLKAIAKEPGERYQTAGELAEDLRRFLANKPIGARRTSLVDRTRLWCRRNPMVASLAVALIIVLFVGSGLTTWAALYFQSLADQRQQALHSKDELVSQLTNANRIATERLFNSARFHYEQQDYELALDELSALLEAEPNHSDALWWRALTNGRLDRSSDAVEDYTRFIALNGDSAKGYAGRGTWYGRRGSNREAVEDFAQAVAINPNHPQYRNELAWHDAMGPPESWDMDRALAYSLRAVELDPESATYRTTLGIVHYRRGEYERAIEVLQQVNRLSPKNAFHSYFTAMSYQKLGDLRRSVEHHRRADRGWQPARNVTSYWYGVQESIAREAEALIGQYLQTNPDHFDLIFRRAMIRRRLQEPEGAVADTTRMIELRPDRNDGYFWRGRARMSLAEDELAIKDIQKSLSMKPDDYWANFYLAWLHALNPQHEHDLQIAHTMAEEVGRQNPESYICKEVMGLILYRQGEYEAAVDVLRSIDDPSLYGAVQQILALCLFRLDRPDPASRHLAQADKAWNLEPDLEPYWARVRATLDRELEEVTRSD